ncbi:hypothetical protein IAD21_00278 [Abditibacteriota bacterium]|nr:hypothetical protein IAD21_00278 [Abditibacteriota bacterium]
MPGYSMDLRERIVAALEAGERVVSVAARFEVGERTVRAYRQLAREGQLAPRPRPGKAPRLPKEQEASFVAMIQETPNWTIVSLQGEWHKRTGVFLPSSTLHDHLKRLGGRYKKRVVSPASATTRSGLTSGSKSKA